MHRERGLAISYVRKTVLDWDQYQYLSEHLIHLLDIIDFYVCVYQTTEQILIKCLITMLVGKT